MAGTVVADRYEAVIGLEVHVELSTATKMFCGCPIDFGGEPNTRSCPVCLGMPGSLPVPNAEAVASAIRLGLALGCDIAPRSQFHRKNYFYPDMPKNYQISQYDVPICLGGKLEVPGPDGAQVVGITRVHMEEDTGKSLHIGESGRIHGASHSLIDYNRAGIPLLEIVSEPDIRSPEQARAYLAELRGIVLALGISDARLEEGSMRCDANISLRPASGGAYGTRVEVKNMNSLRSLQRAVGYEIGRQAGLLDAGQPVTQETRHWDEAAGATSTLRAKEEVFDYRYFPDPDLVPVEPDQARIEELRAHLPELPAAVRRRLTDEHGLSGEQAVTLVDAGLAPLLDEAVAAGAPPRDAAKWLANEVLAWHREARAGVSAEGDGSKAAKGGSEARVSVSAEGAGSKAAKGGAAAGAGVSAERARPEPDAVAGSEPDAGTGVEGGGRRVELADLPLSGAHLAELVALVEEGTLSTKLARQVLEGVLAGEGSPSEVADARGVRQVSDEGELARMADEAIAAQPEAAEKVRAGNDKAIGALVGAVMKASRGQANPQRVNELLRQRLGSAP